LIINLKIKVIKKEREMKRVLAI